MIPGMIEEEPEAAVLNRCPLPLRRTNYYTLFRRYAAFDTIIGDYGVGESAWDRFICDVGLSGDGGLYHGDHFLVFRVLNKDGRLDFNAFIKGMTTLSDRLNHKGKTRSPMVRLMVDDERRPDKAFPKSVAADPELIPNPNKASTRSIIREVLPTPSARSNEAMRLLGGCLNLYNRGKFEQALGALAIARAAWERDAVAANAPVRDATAHLRPRPPQQEEEEEAPSSLSSLFRTHAALPVKSALRVKSALPASVELYFVLLEAGLLLSDNKVNEAEKAMKKEKDCLTGAQGTAMTLASYHIHGLINYYRGNLEHAAEEFCLVKDLGYTYKGALVEECCVAGANNLALCQELLGEKMKALYTMKELNTKVQRTVGRSVKPSTQTVLRNITKLQTTPVTITSDTLANPASNALIIPSPRSLPVKVGHENTVLAFLDRLSKPKVVDEKKVVRKPPKKPLPKEENGKKGKKVRKPKKKAATTIWGQKFIKSMLPRYGQRNISVATAKGKKKK